MSKLTILNLILATITIVSALQHSENQAVNQYPDLSDYEVCELVDRLPESECDKLLN